MCFTSGIYQGAQFKAFFEGGGGAKRRNCVQLMTHKSTWGGVVGMRHNTSNLLCILSWVLGEKRLCCVVRII